MNRLGWRLLVIGVGALLGIEGTLLADAGQGPRRIDVEFSGRLRDVVVLEPNQLAILVRTMPEELEGVAAVNNASTTDGSPAPEDSAEESRVEIRIEVGDGSADPPESPEELESLDDLEGLEDLYGHDDPEGGIAVEVWQVDLAVYPPTQSLVYEGRHRRPNLGVGDLDADGVTELVLTARDEVVDLGGTVENPESSAKNQVHRYSLRGLDARSAKSVGTPSAGQVRLSAVTPGQLRLWYPGSLEDGPARYPLPLKTTREPWGLNLSSPPVSVFVAPRDGNAAEGRVGDFIIGPTVHGSNRLQSVVQVRGEERYEAWALLEAEEEVESSRYVEIDGRVYLLVLSKPRGGVFAKLRLSVFSLQRDRSRSGTPPVFRFQLDSYFWYSPEVVIRDDDGDGRDDLLVSYPEGLGGGDLVLLRARGLGGGRFSLDFSRRKMEFHEDEWRFGDDVDGDGAADLLTLGDDLRIHTSRSGRKLLEKRAIVLPGSERRPVAEGDRDSGSVVGLRTPLDVDGDGVAEILIELQDTRGSRFSIIWPDRSRHAP